MLISLIALLALQLSEAAPWLSGVSPDVAAATADDDTRYRPDDPSTLTLAFIGAGTLGVYFAARRPVRSRRPVAARETGRPSFEPRADTPSMQPIAAEAAEPSRGAA